jgi:hypothetical protein
VLTPDIYDPALNPLYRDVLTHYGVVGLPCRVGDPDRKGKVESGTGHTQRTSLHGMRFETIEAAQAYLDHWDTRWADTRIHGTTKRQVAAMFAEEQPALQPLPLEPDEGACRFATRRRREIDLNSFQTPRPWLLVLKCPPAIRLQLATEDDDVSFDKHCGVTIDITIDVA